jgi:arylsulfatase A-like enzyme
MRISAFPLIVASPILAAAVACSRSPDPPAPTATTTPPNVIIVLVDTLRADHMSLYGYERPTTPFIDSFAADAVVFEHARSQANCTFPSVNSLLTSRYPGIFIRQEEGQLGIPENTPSIAEILKAEGYHTIAVSASHIVRATPTEYNPNGGFGRGFDSFVEGCRWLHGACVNHHVFDELDIVEEPFFLYIHYMDPHELYQPPKRWEKRFAGEYDGYDFIGEGDPNPIAEMLYDGGPELDITEGDIQHLVDLYDDEIRYFDGVFRRLVRNLEERGLLDHTLIVFAADHGEEFMEHGHVKHCRGVWNTLTHVPLIFRFPGIDGGKRISSAVQNLDIVPTVLDYLGIESDGFGLEGVSLRPLIEDREPTQFFAFTDSGRYRAVDDGRWHFILDGVESSATFYDLHNDPLEQYDLFAGGRPEVERLSAALNSWLQDTGQWLRFDEALAAAKVKEEELRALGYLE